MKHITSSILLSTATAFVLSAASASAQNPNYAPGDLVLFFQKNGGTNTIMANLGNAATLYRGAAAGPGAPNRIEFLDISAELVTAFGDGWATDPSVYAGLAAVWGTSNTSSTLQDGDPHRTLYVSRGRSDVGTVGVANSTAWNITTGGSGASSSGSSGILSQNSVLEVSYLTAVAVSPTSISRVDDQNPFIGGGIQGVAFSTFSGGVQQVGTSGTWGSGGFGAAGTVEFALDLYRILGRNDVAGQVGGVTRVGSYEGTVTVNSAGLVSFISQGAAPASNYEAWVTTFNPPLTDANDRLPNVDPDNDGFDNLEEFVLNGNPSVSSQAITPVLDASGENFLFSFTRRDDSVTEAPATFQYGSDLSGWTNVPVAASGTVDGVIVAVTPGDAITDGVVVTLPKSKAVGGKLFGRLQIVK